jgi:hypothetical protein
MPICFYVRCKPQGADAIELVKHTKRVFLGYPPYKKGRFAIARANNIHESMYDLSRDEPRERDLEFEYKREVSKNANLIREVVSHPGSIVLVPRPESGQCFLGKVERFELVNDPPWLPQYKTLRLQQANRLRSLGNDIWSEDREHFGDVVQTFIVNALRAIPLFAIPAWIRYQLFGRATASRIVEKIPGQQPYQVLEAIYNSPTRPIDVSFTLDTQVVEERLLNFTSPVVFEHLMCELLQLEYPDQYWWHVGGVGDGGVDALGFRANGQIVGALQCKLAPFPQNALLALGKEMNAHFPESDKPTIFVCSLHSKTNSVRENNVVVYGRRGIVELLLRHREQSVFAVMLGLRKLN